MKYITIAVTVLALAACEEIEQRVPDQCLRTELFQQCLDKVPAGPISSHYNDWGEVASECESAAYHQSIRF